MLHIIQIKELFEIIKIVLISHYHFLILTYISYLFTSFPFKARRALDLSTLPIDHSSSQFGYLLPVAGFLTRHKGVMKILSATQ